MSESKPQKKYQNLAQESKETYTLESISNILHWDQETYLPEKGAEHRANQIELLSEIIHKRKTATSFKKKLEELIDLESGTILCNDLEERQIAALKAWRKDFNQATKLPTEFVQEGAKLVSQSAPVWVKAKTSDEYSLMLPYYEKLFAHARKTAEYYGYQEHPYDALIDLYEPGMTTKKLNELFSELKPFLIKLTKKLSQKNSVPAPFFSASYDEKKQMDFCHFLLETIGIDFEKGRLDHTEHPFCISAHPHDLRLTTHSDLTSFFNNISAVMHEGGHGLYEQGLPAEDYGTPLGQSVSLGIHESQSRFWEVFIGNSKPFCHFLLNELSARFPNELKGIDVEALYDSMNVVRPSLIRIYADEVTYVLHVILRFEIERDLIEGKISLKDLPQIWNEKMHESLGISPPNSKQGCLQDVHWSHGLIGYFPTYALGNVYAGQLMHTFAQECPDWESRVKHGHMHFIRDFLKEKVHRFGREYLPQQLIEKATGSPVSAKYYQDYLLHKFDQ